MIGIWAAALRGKVGWRRYGNALLYGAVAALAFPPFNATPALWFCFPALVFLLQGTPDAKRAFAVGWCFAFGMLTVNLYWIAASMFVDLKQFWWAVPLAVAGLPALFALYYALAAVVARRWGLERLDGVLVLALAWFCADYARGHLFTGFPWDVTGYVWSGALPMLQITSVIGIYGLTLLTLVCAVLPAAALMPSQRGRNVKVFVASLLLLGAVAAWGGWRLYGASDGVVPDVRLRLVEPDVAQANKWKREQRQQHLDNLLEHSFAAADKPVTHIIWPETATSFYLTVDEARRQEIAARLKSGMSVLTGVVRALGASEGKASYYNAMIAIDDRARVTAGYDKFHLVPFGEYMPWRRYIPLPALIGEDFSAGEGPRTIRVAGLPPFSPLICYEVIFPGEVTDDADRPQFLLNLSNDAWYEGTTGPWQHYAIARVRAVEEGMPLVRVANKSVTGVVDAYGRLVAHTAWGKAGFVDSALPLALPELTLYAQYRDMPLGVMGGLVLLAALWLRRKGKKGA